MKPSSSSSSAGGTGVAERSIPRRQKEEPVDQTTLRRRLVQIPFVGRGVLLHRTKSHGGGITCATIFHVHEETGERHVDLTATSSEGQPYSSFRVPYGTETDNWEFNRQLDLAMWGADAGTMGEKAQNAGA